MIRPCKSQTRIGSIHSEKANIHRLRLWLYRSLGITLGQDEAGNYNKATIGNTKKGDVHVVNIDPKFSSYFYADYFWQTMQG